MEVERTLGQLCAVHAKLEHESKLLSCISHLICRGQRYKAAPAVQRLPTRYVSGGSSTCSSDEATCSQSLGLCSWLSRGPSLASVPAQQEHAAQVLRMDAWQDRRSKHSKAHRRSGCRHSRRLELEQVDAGEGGRSRYLTEAQPASGQDRVTRQSDDTQPAARQDRRSRPEDPMQSDSECDIVRPALDEARRSRRRVTDEGAHRVER